MWNRSVSFVSVLVVVLVTACAESYMASPPDECECAVSEVCGPSGCVADCSPELAADIATLHPSLRVVSTFCVTLEPGPLGAVETSPGRFELTQVRAETVARDTTMQIERMVGSVASRSLTTIGAPCDATFTADRDAVRTDLTRDVAVSADGRHVAWGLRATEVLGPESSRTVTGAWYVASAGCEVEENSLYRVSALAFDRETSRWPRVFVSGSPEGGVWMGGVFLDGRRVYAESTPGSLWPLDEGLLFGGVLGHGSMPATYLPLAAARAGEELRVGMSGVVTGDPMVNQFVVVPGIGLIHDHGYWDESIGAHVDGLVARSIDVGGDGIAFGEEVVLTGSAFTAAVPVLGTSRVLLRHASGLVLVE